MFLLLLVYVATMVCGFVAAQVVASGYAAFAGEKLSFAHLVTPGFFQPPRALTVVAAAPVLLLTFGLGAWAVKPLAGALIVAFSFVWSFLLGVVIVTQFLGVT
jgi:hypothetical protein